MDVPSPPPTPPPRRDLVRAVRPSDARPLAREEGRRGHRAGRRPTERLGPRPLPRRRGQVARPRARRDEGGPRPGPRRGGGAPPGPPRLLTGRGARPAAAPAPP